MKLYPIPVGFYMFKVSNRNTKTSCKTYSNLTIKTPERRQWRRSGGFYCKLWTYFTVCSSVSIVKFEQVNAGWDDIAINYNTFWLFWSSKLEIYFLHDQF